MEVENDFKELLVSFNEHEVEYVIVGAYALAYHGVPRYTGDMDILVRPSPSNAEKVLSALEDLGFGSLGLRAGDFLKPDHAVQLGVSPVRIDILTSLTGVSWREASAGKVEGSYGGIAVHFLGREQIIANKRVLGRKQDLADLEALGEE
ncbi:MAG: hypothetical protein AB1384_06275 [Actinomycetota bacterium]